MGARARLRALGEAIDERTGAGALLRRLGGKPMRGGARLGHATGSLALFAFAVQVVTGVALATAYAPTATDAWGSVYYIQHHMVLGSFVRAVHHWGSSAIIILSVLHMTQVLLYGAHRAPRDANWILGVLMLLLVLGMGLTGYMLPWDQKGYWSARVVTGIISDVPGGEALKRLLIGGAELGNASLTRLYGIHALILPTTLGLLALVHVALHLRHGPKAPPRREAAPAPPFWPHQALRNAVLAGLVLTALIAVALLVGVALEAPADPSSGYDARPEWYFLFLFQLLKLFDGPLSFVGTVVIPTLGIAFLFAIPLLDRRAPDSTKAPSGPSRRVLIPYAAMLAAVVALEAYALVSDARNEEYQAARVAAGDDASEASRLAAAGGIDRAGRVVLYEGLRLYRDKGCATCHDAASPDRSAPSLTGYGTRERLSAFLDDPNTPRFFGGTSLDGMMSPVALDDPADRDALLDWLQSLGGAPPTEGRPAPSAATLARGREVFVRGADCLDCHNDPALEPWEKGYELRAFGPDLAGLYSFEWTRALVRDAGHPRFFGGALAPDQRDTAMPDFPDLTDDELGLLTRWLLAGAPGADQAPAPGSGEATSR